MSQIVGAAPTVLLLLAHEANARLARARSGYSALAKAMLELG